MRHSECARLNNSNIWCVQTKLLILFSYNIQSYMSTFGIEFAVTCETNYGQRVCICGNLASLGQWNPAAGVILETDKKSYPLWSTAAPLSIKQGLQVQFKLCILKSSGELSRWQEIVGNRTFVPKGSLVIEFNDSDPSMIFKMPRKQSGPIINVQNCRKGTEEVINEWGSDSSSNRDMWPKHQEQDQEEGSLLLTQFTEQLTRSVASQREQSFSTQQLQPEMQLHEMDFGAFANHYYHTHYALFAQLAQPYERLVSKYSKDQMVIMRRDSLPNLQLNHKQEVSLFHILDWNLKQDTSEYIKLIMRHWKRAAQSSMRGLIIIYFENDPSLKILEELLEIGVSIFVVNTIESTNNALSVFTRLNYNVFCMKPDVFTARKNIGKQVKLIFTPFSKKNLLTNFEEEIEELKPKLLQHYYFSFENKEFEVKLNEKLSVWKMSKGQCLIILQVWRLDDIENRTISDLIHLSSQRFRVIVFVITHERFPRNIQHKIPVAKHKVIFINTFGDLYTNTGQFIDLFYYLEINKATFQTNQNIILEQLGSGINKYYWKNCSLVLDFPQNTLGNLLRTRALRLVRDVNKKSIAKLIVQSNGTSLQLVPFCLHLSFLYKAILTTFALRFNHYQKGTVINIDGTDLSTLRYLQVPQGPERTLKFLRFCLRTRETRASYSCNPMSELQLQKMIQLISDECQYIGESSAKKGQVLMQIKNIR